MAKTLELKIMRCPTCGASLKVENPNEVVACVYCGNEIVPVMSSSGGEGQETTGMSVRVEGLKTPASALAYLELFFDDFDWGDFIYSASSSIYELDKLANGLKASSANDKNTWFFCFKATCRPFTERVIRSKSLLNDIVREYKNDNLDAYSNFDAYKMIIKSLRKEYPVVVSELKKNLFYAQKYGATSDDLAELEREIPALDLDVALKVYDNIDDVPEIDAFINEKNLKIIRELEQDGINAQQEYEKAVSFIGNKEYVEALNILTKLRGYSDSNKLIKKIDRIFSISNIWEIEGVQYQLRKEETKKETLPTFALYPINGDRFAEHPIIKKIAMLIANYADNLYYIDSNKRIKAYDLKNRKERIIDKKAYSVEGMEICNSRRKVFIFTESENGGLKTLCELNLIDGKLSILKEKIKSVLSYSEGRFAITEYRKNENSKNNNSSTIATCIFDVDDLTTYYISGSNTEICGFIDNSVVYTKLNPDKNNKRLYIKSLDNSSNSIILETNICDFCNIISGKVYYYIGNSKNRILVSINPDKTGRKEISLYMRSVLFEQGGWLYFVRGYGYNTVVCKSKTDGTQTSVICSDIDEFIKIENGYLYYINTSSSLIKVRMDGTNACTLCNKVEKVLSIDGEKVIYVSIDSSNVSNNGYTSTTKNVQSIYVTDPKIGGRMKLAYNVIEAAEYDEDYIYYISKEKASTNKTLNKMSIHTYESEKILTFNDTVVSGGCYVATSVYGSYDCPQVWTLRRYRDSVLAGTWYGRLFIYLYYAVSPTIVKLFGETTWFKNFWKLRLDKMINSLQSQGFENTPYNDKVWKTK